jgi:hypothetical protein
MLQGFYGRKGQGVSAEYVLLISVLAIAVTAMTIYVRRALQGRMHDAVNQAAVRSAGALGQDVLLQYEPYYVNSSSDTIAKSLQEDAGEAGIYKARRDTFRNTRAASTQLPVTYAD